MMTVTNKTRKNAKKEHQIKSGSDKKDKAMILGGSIKFLKIRNLNGKSKDLKSYKTLIKVKIKIEILKNKPVKIHSKSIP